MPLVEDALTFLTQRMQIDAEWAVQAESSFTWWPSSLAQRVWVAPARAFQGVELRTLHIETDLLSGITLDDTANQHVAPFSIGPEMPRFDVDRLAGLQRLPR